MRRELVEVDGERFVLLDLPRWFPADGLTLGRRVFLRPELRGTRYGHDVLRHEAVHVRDQRRWHVLWWLSYLLLLPAGPGLRAVWEWRAYRVTLRAEHERLGRVTEATRAYVARMLSGPAYLWMLPAPRFARRLVDRYADALEAGSP